MVFTFLENVLNLGIFANAPLFHTQNLPSSLYYYYTLGRGKLFTHQGKIFFENLFPPTAERRGGNYDLLCKNSIRNYENKLEN